MSESEYASKSLAEERQRLEKPQALTATPWTRKAFILWVGKWKLACVIASIAAFFAWIPG
ncbi:hypothetical protein FA13DRAFT_1725603 [Coprinellus micaceus]|uniref:Uncharacterized protein n=1 Tax=Coprinellus micaceus TaxID=71717 RepID=A0A4Y7SEQ5_COPMI|nr:hypothetical protein FA13DRAFT_1743542 [Coprinellus micaceus]TEB37979.1 hypothetical protein FA13DRAFT_1725603 [Coprinellus micaceus]